MASLKRIAEIAQRGLEGGSIGLESHLHYKENLTCFLCFHACKTLNIIKMNMRMGARENIAEQSTG